MNLNRSILKFSCIAVFGLALTAQPQIANAQIDLTWTVGGGGDGSTFSDDANWTPSAGVGGPEFAFTSDALKFNTAGVTINNDLDPTTNTTPGSEGLPLQLGIGADDNATSGAFHFQSGAGSFTFDGFEIQIGTTAGVTAIRAEPTAGTTQTFNLPISLGGDGGNDNFVIAMNNTVIDTETTLPSTYGEVVLNGEVNYNNDRFFIDETAARVVINGDNLGAGVRSIGGLANTDFTTNIGRVVLVNRVGGFGSEIVLGSNTALGNPSTGSWADGTLDLRGMQTLSAAFLDTTAPLDLSAYHFQLQSGNGAVGASINYKSEHNSSVGYVSSARGNRWLRTSGTGALTVANGLFLTDNFDARIMVLAAGTSDIVIDGTIHNSLIDPIAATGMIPDPSNPGQFITVNGGVDNSSRGGIAFESQLTALDGSTPVNGTLQIREGRVELNGDSSSTFIGGQVYALNGGTVVAGNDGAFGDSNSVVSVASGATVDIGSQTIEQRFSFTEGTIRGSGTLTNEADWSINGTVQPGGESPSSADVLTFDFSTAAVGNTLQFESASTADFVLDSGLTSSTIDVLGPSLGGTTNVIFDDNTFSFSDLTAGNLTEGAYTLFDGDANTSFSLGAGVTVDAPAGYIGSLSLSGDDVILNLVEGSTSDADFNEDEDVDGQDFLTWQRNVGLTGIPNLQPFGDANGDGAIDGLDLTEWQTQYGGGAPLLDASVVPEPSSVMLLLAGIALCATRSRCS